jgi:glycosyltransferase involved in cell wall biosynthesis
VLEHLVGVHRVPDGGRGEAEDLLAALVRGNHEGLRDEAGQCLDALRADRTLVVEVLGQPERLPNIYGSLAAQTLGIPVINNIAGLGSTFIADNFITKVVRRLYKTALKRSHFVFFQNADDRALFIGGGLVEAARTGLVPGSGLNLNHYAPAPQNAVEERPFRFLMVARMLKDKGVEEFVAAGRLLRERGRQVQLQLLGSVDTANPNAVSPEQIAQWEHEGFVAWLGKTDDVRPYLSQADCVVLPSYREGVPRSLLEAAAMGRPIIATDVPGCREAVSDGRSGLLCQVRDPADLAVKMAAMMDLSAQERAQMGTAGRRKMESEFDEQIVIQRYLHALSDVDDAVVPSNLPDLLPEQSNS